MMTDPISDLLTRVRNGVHAKQPKVDVPASQLKVAIVDLWKKGGYIRNYKLYRQDQRGILRIYFKYVEKGTPVIQGLRRVSRPSRRVYANAHKIPKVLNGLGMSVISTSRGVVSDEAARESKVGGEILCSIW